MKSRKTILCLITPIVSVILMGALWHYWPMMNPSPGVIPSPEFELPKTLEGIGRDSEERFLGYSDSEIIDRYGQPTERWYGHYACPPIEYVEQYPGAETLMYARRDETLYLSFVERDGKSVCFTSSWLSKGSAF